MFAAYRLASDIDVFRKAGHPIRTEILTRNGCDYARYHYMTGL